MRTFFYLAYLILSVVLAAFPAACEEPFQKGMCFVSWEKDRYSSAFSDEALRKLSNIGVQWVSIVVTCYQKEFNSKEIFPTEKTPTDKSLVHAINKAHEMGLKVILKPHIDLLDESSGLWRADIGFQSDRDWQEWFGEYLKFIQHYARIAEENRVEIFCSGTELAFASQRQLEWRNIVIPGIRRVYSGKVIYAANWDEYKKIKFWDCLDYAGIDAYFPLTEKNVPEFDELKNAWNRWADEIELWQNKVGKPVVLTEIGYSSCEYSAARPWESAYNKKVNLDIQADCYNAAMEVLSRRQWCKGIYWWYWRPSVYAGGPNNRDFTPQNKPAETILASWYRLI